MQVGHDGHPIDTTCGPVFSIQPTRIYLEITNGADPLYSEWTLNDHHEMTGLIADIEDVLRQHGFHENRHAQSADVYTQDDQE